jgi:protocatechuate 3,4-dioxygenase beta subunit
MGVSVPLNTGVRATGRLVFSGVAARPTAAQLSVLDITIESAEGRHPAVFNADRVRPTGDTFQTAELVPGKYLINAAAPAGWTMKSAMAGGHDIADTPLVVDGGEIPPITITFTDRPLASLTGTVRRSGELETEASVCLFPAERGAWTDYGNAPRRVRRVQLNQFGVYRIAHLPPGNYLAAAVVGDRASDWRDPAHLAALSRIATRVTIADEESKSLDLQSQRAPRLLADPTSVEAQPTGFDALQPDADAADPGNSGPFVADENSSLQKLPRASPTPTPEPVGSGAIKGIITSGSAGGGAVRRVVVTLNSADPKIGRTTVTDDAGRFEFTALPAGRYSVAATKPGYLAARYGATGPGGTGTPIVLKESEHAAIAMILTKGSVITGTIRDSNGEPVQGVAVNVSRYEFSNGERRLTSAGRSQPSDDRGQYRIYDLAASEYFVSTERPPVGVYRSLPQTTAEDLAAAERELRAGGPVTSAPAAAIVLPDMGYAPVFYPGTTLFSQAGTVTVGAGEERSGVDISMNLVRLAHIQARVLGPDGLPPAMVQAQLTAQIQVPGSSQIGLSAGTIVPVTDGIVRISAVPPGEYTLHVGGSTVAPPPMGSRGGGIVPAAGALGLPMWAALPLTIDGHDIDGLTIQLELGKVMTGRVVFDGATTPPESVSVLLAGPRLGANALSRRGMANPAFSIDGIVPGAYRVSLAGVRGWIVKSAIVDGRDAADLPVEIASDKSDVVITLTDRLTELSGILQTPAGAPASSYFVIVFPKDPAYWFSGSRRIVGLRPSTDGRFATTPTSSLPPGDYLIAAVTDVASGEWFNPELLKTLATSAVPITFADGEKKRQDLRVLK